VALTQYTPLHLLELLKLLEEANSLNTWLLLAVAVAITTITLVVAVLVVIALLLLAKIPVEALQQNLEWFLVLVLTQ
jgi:hypothetical protein